MYFNCFIFDRPFNHKIMPRTPKQFEKIRETKRKQIMDAALELFANEGYHSTSISDIARAAKISKGLMYNYFDSKEELVNSVMDDGMKIFTDYFDPDKDGVLTTEEFEFFVIKSFETLKNNTTYWRLYFSIIMQTDVFKLVMNKYESVINEMMQVLVSYYKKQGVEDPMAEALLFGASMDGVSMNYVQNPDMFPLDKMQEMIIRKFGHK